MTQSAMRLVIRREALRLQAGDRVVHTNPHPRKRPRGMYGRWRRLGRGRTGRSGWLQTFGRGHRDLRRDHVRTRFFGSRITNGRNRPKGCVPTASCLSSDSIWSSRSAAYAWTEGCPRLPSAAR